MKKQMILCAIFCEAMLFTVAFMLRPEDLSNPIFICVTLISGVAAGILLTILFHIAVMITSNNP